MFLLELVKAYSIFPNAGMSGDITGIKLVKTLSGKEYKPSHSTQTEVIQPETAFLISHILSDYKYKVPGFGVNSAAPFPLSFGCKNRNIKGLQAQFIVAFDNEITLGIWNGNLSGEPMRDLPSAAGGGIVLRDIAVYLYNHAHSFRQAKPEGLNIISKRICKLSGMLAGEHCDADEEFFIRGTEPRETCTLHKPGSIELPDQYATWASENLLKNYHIQTTNNIKITYPIDGDVFQLSSEIPDESQQISLKASSKFADIEWFLDGKKIARGKSALWQLTPGEFKLEARADNGRATNAIKIIIIKG